MVHKSSILPGLTRFIDESVLSHYEPTSIKRILMAGAVSLYLKKNERIVDTLVSNPLVSGLGVVTPDGMVDLESLRDSLKKEINKVGFMRLSLPMVGDIDFTTEDIDMLYKFISEANTSYQPVPSQQLTTSSLRDSSEVY
jgi:hypothetical protein